MVTVIHNLFPIPCLNVDFAETKPSYVLNGTFKKDGFNVMLGGNYYLAVDAIFPCVCDFADRYMPCTYCTS